MLSGFPDAMPLEGFAGGLLIGLAAAIMLLGLGRIAGVSGMAARATGIADTGAPGAPRNVAIAFVLGLPLGAFLIAGMVGAVQVSFPASIWPLVIGGLFVGYGTRLGSGCTSGHGVCGLSRLSPRSMVATGMFMASGFLTVGLLRAGGLL